MTIEIAVVAVVILVMIVCLIREVSRPDFIVFCALMTLLVTGILSPEDALSGFANEGMLTVAALFVIAGTVEQSGLLNQAVTKILGHGRRPRLALARMMFPVAGLSAFLNNTPIVVMLTPIIRDWCKKNGLPPSKFLLPLSYATIFGGTMTLIGTSTNLLVHGWMLKHGLPGLSMFTLTIVSLPAGLLAIAYVCTLGYRLLPSRKTSEESFAESAREYLAEALVESDSPLIQKTIEEAGLRSLAGLFLIEIIRGGQHIAPVSPTERLIAGDRLVFTGLLSTLVELQSIKGLQVETGSPLGLVELQNGNAHLLEAVVSHESSLVSKTIKESRFRTRFGAGVVAVHRSRERIHNKIGDITLRPGDTLLLLGDKDFKERHHNSHDFYLITALSRPKIVNRRKSYVAIAILTTMVLLSALNVLSMFKAAILAVILLLVTRTTSFDEARRAVHLNVLVLIACALGIGTAIEQTGAAALAANQLIQMSSGFGVIGAIATIFLVTNLLTEVLTNNAAAVLMAPVGLAVAQQLHIDPLAFFVTVTIAASGSFSTPIGYQTNLIVYGPGGYQFKDYMKVGLPLNFLYLCATTAIVSVVWL